jgi:hypothetical protein
MKRLLFTLALILLPLFIFSAVHRAYAVDENPFGAVCTDELKSRSNPPSVCDPIAPGTSTDPLTGSNGLILKVIRLLAWVTGAASLIIMIIGSIKYVTSGGDSNSVGSAKSTIVYALVGLVVSLMGQGIIALVINRIR